MMAKSSGVRANTAPAEQHSCTSLNPRGIALKFGLEACSSSHQTGNQSVGARNQKRWALICGARKRLNPTWCTEVKWLKRGAWEQLVRAHEVKKSGWLNACCISEPAQAGLAASPPDAIIRRQAPSRDVFRALEAGRDRYTCRRESERQC